MEGQLVGANDVVERQLDESLAGLESMMGAAVLAFSGPLYHGIDEMVREAAEKCCPTPKKAKLVCLLETDGGYVQPVERIVGVFRRHFRQLEFVVPNFAMSAGTILVMSGDAVHMDYFSVLGPIDPQVRRGNRLVPANGYLSRYNDLIEKSREGTLTDAELTYLLSNFDPGEMYTFEQEAELARSLLVDWLASSKLIDWGAVKGSRSRLTRKMRLEKAREVADCLGDADRWHSHARGISIEILRRDIGLAVQDFGESEDLSQAIRSYYTLLRDYMARLRRGVVVHVRGYYRSWRLK